MSIYPKQFRKLKFQLIDRKVAKAQGNKIAERGERVTTCMLIISNHVIVLVQFGVNFFKYHKYHKLRLARVRVLLSPNLN